MGVFGGAGQGHRRQIDAPLPGAAKGNAGLREGASLVAYALDELAHRRCQALVGHDQHVQRGASGGVLEVGARVAQELHDLEAAVHHHRRWSELGQQHARRRLERVELDGAFGGGRRRGNAGVLGAGKRSAEDDGEMRGDVDSAKDLVALVDHGEEIGCRAERFRAAQHEKAAGAQGVVQQGQHALLQADTEIDQQVATDDQVEPREGRIAGHVVAREDAHLADGRVHTKAVVDGRHEAIAVLVGQRRHPAFAVQAAARPRQLPFVDVGGQDLDRKAPAALAHRLSQHHGQAVRLLAAGAARHPDADLASGLTALEDGRQDQRLETVVALGLAKEVRDHDEHVVVELLELGTIAADQVGIVVQRLDAMQGHAPFGAAHDRALLVAGEVDAIGLRHARHDTGRVVVRLDGSRALLGARPTDIRVLGEAHELAAICAGASTASATPASIAL